LLSQGKVNVDRRLSRVKILIDDISAETRLKNAGVRGESLTSYRMAVQPGLFDSDERLQARRAIYWNGCRLWWISRCFAPISKRCCCARIGPRTCLGTGACEGFWFWGIGADDV